MATSNRKIRIPSYIKNVGRSLGYAVGDAVGAYNPTLKSILSTSKSTISDAKRSIREMKVNSLTTARNFNNGQNVYKNLLDDLKTGNWYNKEREEKMFDFDDDFDFDFDDDLDDEGSSSENGARDIIESNENSTRDMISSVNQVGSSVSKSFGYASAKSAEYIVASTNKSLGAMYELNANGFNQVSNILLGMNTTLTGIAQLGQPLAEHMQNSAMFYTKTTQTLQSIDENLAKLAKRTEFLDPSIKKNSKNKVGIESLFNGKDFDFGSYMDMVKENFKEQKEMYSGLIEMAKMAAGTNGKNISPIQGILVGGMKALIPAVTKEAMKDFNETIANALTVGLARGAAKAKSSGNPLINILGSIFLPQDKYKDTVDPSKYNKGPVPWDGKSRKAVMEVIPTYLAQINARLGGEEKYYDYEKGRYVRRSDIKKNSEREKRLNAAKAGGDFRKDLLSEISKDGGMFADDYMREVESFFFNAFVSGADISQLKDKLNNPTFLKKMGLSRKSAQYIKKYIETAKGRNNALKFEARNVIGRNEYGDSVRRREESGDDVLNHLNNGFVTEMENHNNMQIKYLKGIYTVVANIYNNMQYGNNVDGTGNARFVNYDIGKGDAFANRTGAVHKTEVNTASNKIQETMSDTDIATVNMTDAQKEAYLRQEKQKEGFKKGADSLKNTTGELLSGFGGKVKGIKNKMSNLKDSYAAPFVAFGGILEKMSDAIGRLFYGDDKNEGIIYKLQNEGISSVIDSIKQSIKEKILNSDLFMAMRGQFRNLVGRGKETVGNFFYGKEEYARRKAAKAAAKEAAAREREVELVDNGMAYKGRKITRTGIAAVSEGEMIIPSELNPYYHGATNKAAQRRNEMRAYNKFYGFYADGGEVGNTSFLYKYKQSLKKKSRTISEKVQESGVYNGIKQGALTLINGIMNTFSFLAGKGKKKDHETEKKKVMTVISEAGENKGIVGLGALGGAGISLLTGALIGPIAGAALGAGIALTSRSNKVQEILFGSKDPNDKNYGKGILKGFGVAIRKHIPEVKGGIAGMGIGTLAGIFMGSPLIGAIAGAGIGYLSKSEKAAKWLFGDENEDGVIPKEFVEKMKKAAPNMTAGAIAGLVAGPFGLAGNIIAGSALGYMSTSDKFHEFIFGKENGLATILKDRVLKYIDDIFKNMAYGIKGFLKKTGDKISRKVGSIFESLRARFMKVSENSKIIGGITKLVGGAVRLPFRAAGKITETLDKGLKKRNLKKGYDVSNNGKKLSASERLELRKKLSLKTEGNFAEVDQFLAGVESADELDAVRDVLKSIQNRKYAKKKADNDVISNFYSEIAAIEKANGITLDPKTQNKIMDKLRSGDINGARKLLEKAANGEAFADAFNNASIDIEKNKNTKYVLDQNRKLLKKKGFKGALNDTNISSFIGAIDTEKSIRFKDAKSADPEKFSSDDPYENIMVKQMTKITNAVMALTKHKDGIPGTNTILSSDDESGDGDSIQDKLNNTGTITTPFGDMMQTETNNQGETVLDLSDSETKKSMKSMDKLKSSIFSLGTISAGIGSLTGLFGKIKDGLFGNSEEGKSGFLTKLLTGIGALFSPFTSWIKSAFGGLVSVISKIAGKLGLSAGGLLKDALIGTALYAGFSGKLDAPMSKLTNDAYNETSQKDARTYTATLKDGSVVTYKYENGKKVDIATGEIIKDSDIQYINESGTGRASFSDKLKYNATRGVLTNTKSLTSVALSKTTVGKALSKNSGKITEKLMSGAIGRNMADNVCDGVIKFTNMLRKIPALSGVADKLDDMGLALAQKIEKALSKESAEKLAKFAANAVLWAKVAFIVVDFTTGYEDARTTLGIVQEPTFGQKIISGLLRAIKNFIPIIGTLIPDELVVDVFCDYIAPALGIDVEELKNQRAESKEIVDKYNTEHGTNYSVGDFIKEEMHDYTWTERMKNAGARTVEETKTRFSNMKKSIKEKGLFGAMGDGISNMASDFMKSYKENGGGLAGIFSGIGTTFRNILPGVIGDIFKVNADILSDGIKGDLGSIWTRELPDFSGGGENIEGTDLQTAVPGVFSRIIGEIPIVLTKFVATPLALLSKVVQGLWTGVKAIGTGIFESVKSVGQGIIILGEKTLSGSITDLWTADVSPDHDGIGGGLLDVMGVIGKVMLTVPTLLTGAVRTLYDNILKPVGETVINTGARIVEGTAILGKEVAKGSLSGLWTADFTPDAAVGDGSGVASGFMTFLVNTVGVAERLVLTVPTLLSGAFHAVKDTVVSVAGAIVDTGAALIKADGILLKDTITGNIKGLWNDDVTPDEDETIATKIVDVTSYIKRIFLTPPALLSAGVQAVGKTIVKAAGAVANFGKVELVAQGTLLRKVINGNVAELWSTDLTPDTDGVIGTAVDVIGYIQKTFMTVPTLLVGGVKAVASGIKTAVGAIATFGTKVADNFIGMLKITGSDSIVQLWEYNTSPEDDGGFGTIVDIVGVIQKVALTPITLIKSGIGLIADGLTAIIGGIKETISGAVDALLGVFNWISDKAKWLGEKVDEAAWEATTFVLGDPDDPNIFGKALVGTANFFSDLFGGRSGLKRDKYSGGDSGFISQNDDKYSGIPIAGTTFANKGCGPAVASMLASEYNKDLPVKEAVNASKNYQNADGTNIKYFKDVLGNKSINASTIIEPSSATIYKSLAHGNKAVLLGQDANNTSKSDSPFGPNGHYVLATGLDSSGNVIINDPENTQPTVYNPSILNNVSATVLANNINPARRARFGGNKLYNKYFGGAAADPATVWAFFKSQGYSDEATAAIMGNLRQESGLDPSRKQNGGPAAGIAQWEGYTNKNGRWADLNNFAISRGTTWDDLETQLMFIDRELQGLDYYFSTDVKYGGKIPGSTLTNAGAVPTTYSNWKVSNDLDMATRQFEGAFERAGRPAMDNRIKYASEYYNSLSGKTYTYTPSSNTSNNNSSKSNSTGGKYSTTGTTLLSLFGKIGSIFSNAFNGIFGLGESTSSNSNNTSNNNADYTYNGTITVSGKTPVQYLKSIAGTLDYDWGIRDPDKGSADCSSTVAWAIKKAGGPDLKAADTGTQYNDNTNFIDIWYNNGNYAQSLDELISAGMKENDVIYFARPNSGYAANRKDKVGHVEMYCGDGKMIGHGGPGKGPKEKTMSFGTKGKIIRVRRVLKDGKEMDWNTDTSIKEKIAKYTAISNIITRSQYTIDTLPDSFFTSNGITREEYRDYLVNGAKTLDSTTKKYTSAQLATINAYRNYGRKYNDADLDRYNHIYSIASSVLNEVNDKYGANYDVATRAKAVANNSTMYDDQININLANKHHDDIEQQKINDKVSNKYTQFGLPVTAAKTYLSPTVYDVGPISNRHTTYVTDTPAVYCVDGNGNSFFSRFLQPLNYKTSSGEELYQDSDYTGDILVKNKGNGQLYQYVSNGGNVEFAMLGTDSSGNYLLKNLNNRKYYTGKSLQDISEVDSSYINAENDFYEYNEMFGAGSGIPSYSQICKRRGGSSGLLLKSRVGSRSRNVSGGGSSLPSISKPRTLRYSGGDSNIAYKTSSMLNTVKSQVASTGGISPDLVAKLIQSISTLLSNIADNTAPVQQIYEALVAYMSKPSYSGGGSNNNNTTVKVVNAGGTVPTAATNTTIPNGEVDSNIRNLVGVLAQLAKG